MSDYTKATNFAAKDTLPVGDANKKVKGSEIDTEFNAISDAIATKADKNSPTFTGTPISTTAAAGTSTTQIATTAFVQTAINTAGHVDTSELADDAVTNAKLAADAVDSDQIADGAIDTVHLAADVITGAKIADNAVDSEHIAADAVGSSEIAANAVSASELNVSGNGSSGQYLRSDGDGSMTWATITTPDSVYTPSVGSNSVSTTGYSKGSKTFTSGGYANSTSFTVGSGEVWLLMSDLSASGSNLFFTHNGSAQLTPYGFVGPGTYYFRGRSYQVGDNDDGYTATPSVSWDAWRVK